MKQILFVFAFGIITINIVNAQSSSASNTLNGSGLTSIQSTTNSNYKLSVGGAIKQFGTGLNSSTSPSLFLSNTTSSTGRNYYINSSDGGLFQIVDSNAGNAIRMVINSSGYMGINTTSPAYHLDVNGSIKTSGNIYLPVSTSTSGIIYMGSSSFLHTIGTENLFLGINAGNLTNTSFYNVGIGISSLKNITTGQANIAVGGGAMEHTTSGSSNTAMGDGALYANTTGGYNTALGRFALFNNNGNDNTAVGESTLNNNTTGNDNIAIGTDVLSGNTTGSRNTAVGRVALNSNVSGNDNTAIGMNVLSAANSSYNTAMGYSAGASITSGTGNAFFGNSTGRSIQTGNNNSFFGFNIYNSGIGNLTGSNNTAVGANITGMGNGNNNTVIGASVTIPNVNNNIILADGQGNQRIRIFNTGNTLIGYSAYADSGYKLDINGSFRNTGAVRFQGLSTNNTLTNILAADASGNLSWRDASTLAASGSNGNSWSTTGNSGMNPVTNFLGTTDSAKLIFKTNNIQRASIFENGTFNIGSNDTASRPLFRVYSNGDFAMSATNDYTFNKYSNKNGVRFNKKLGFFEIGVSNNIDTSISGQTQGTFETSALIINSDVHNTIQGQMISSILNADNTTITNTAKLTWSTVSGESHNINGWINKSNVSGWGMNVGQEIRSSFIGGQAHSFQKPVWLSMIQGYINTPLDTVNISLVSGMYHKYGGVGQLLSGCQLTNKTPYGTTLGNQNVDFTSLSYTGNGGVALAGITNLDKYPIFAIGNSRNAYNSSVKSNALTILYNGRTQINTTGYNTNLTEANVTPKAALEIVSNNTGILIPKLTTTQRDNISSTDLLNGLLLYNTTVNQFQFYNGSSWKSLSDSSAASINASAIGAWSISGNTGINPSTTFIGTTDAQPLIFKTNNSTALTVTANQQVVIGNPTAGTYNDYKLAVGGSIITEKIKVKQVNNWPDYVFNEKYQLPSLKEIQQYISINGHLPEMPTAAEAEKKGVDLAENQKLLLKKIEELTLHLISINEKVEKLSEENEQLKKQLAQSK